MGTPLGPEMGTSLGLRLGVKKIDRCRIKRSITLRCDVRQNVLHGSRLVYIDYGSTAVTNTK
jgi:hypothetical protein